MSETTISSMPGTMPGTMPRTILRHEDAIRIPRPFRFDERDKPRASSEDNRITREPVNPNPQSGFAPAPPILSGESTASIPSINPPLDADPEPLSAEQTLEKTRKAVEEARKLTQNVLGGSDAVSDAVRPGLTIDLGHARIARLPEPVVDLIKNEVERLSLSHNQIWHIPYRFEECSQLRYLNVRSNQIREFPKAVYKLPLLEILDMSRNRLRRIPEEIKFLSSLRVISLMHNRVEELPWSICDMSKLQILKIAENPLRFRLQRLIDQKEQDVGKTTFTDNERELAVTAEIKKFLLEERRGYMLATPAEAESGGETSESTMDTPKPLKRVLSSRFPVIPSTGSTVTSSVGPGPTPDSPAELTIKSPGTKPPPIPTKSHYRMQSGQSSQSVTSSSSNYLRRPGASPLSGGSERNRSNSESTLQPMAPQRPTKRLVLLRQEKSDLDTVEEGPSNRYSHLRGHSYASALRPRMSESAAESGSSGADSPQDRRSRRIPYVKRLSSLPEYKEETSTFNPLLEGAKGILYALYQVHPQISALISVAKAGEPGRNSLDVLFYSASTHIEQLNEALENVSAIEEEEDYKIENLESNIKTACIRCIKCFGALCLQLQQFVPRIIRGSDPRYVRTTMLLLYGSIVEIRNACGSVGFELKPRMSMTKGSGDYSQLSMGQTIRPSRQQQERALNRPGARLRSDTTIHHPTLSNFSSQALTSSANSGQVAYSQAANMTGSTVHGMGFTNASVNSTGYSGTTLTTRSRSNSRAAGSTPSSVSSTPRSGDTFIVPPPNGLANKISTLTGISEAEEERLFEQIFIALTNAYDAALRSLPIARKHFQRSLESAEDGRLPKEVRDIWANLLYRCKTCMEVSEALHMRLINMKVKDPVSGRNQRDFWQLCKSFMQSFVELAIDMRDAKSMQVLTMESIVVLRPVQKASREAGKLIDSSPWSFLADNNATPSISSINQFSSGVQNGISPLSVALPATPLSAALGPAAQATIPSTPASAYGDQFFAGNVFQRADSLLSMPQAGGFPTYNRRT